MLLSHKTDIQLNTTESNIVGHMCYAHLNSGTCATMNAVISRSLEWSITLTGMIRKHG